jgi:hypothetical protein
MDVEAQDDGILAKIIVGYHRLKDRMDTPDNRYSKEMVQSKSRSEPG